MDLLVNVVFLENKVLEVQQDREDLLVSQDKQEKEVRKV